MKIVSNPRGVLRAGGWGDEFNCGLSKTSHVALQDSSAGTQFLARSISVLLTL
jgi:hypothetical protein